MPTNKKKFTNLVKNIFRTDKKHTQTNTQSNSTTKASFGGYNHYSVGAKFKNALAMVKKVFFDRATLLLRSKEEKFKSGIYNSMVYWLMVYTVGTGYSLNSTPLWDIIGITNTKKRAKIRKDIENIIKLIFSSNTIDFSGNMPTWQFFRELFKMYLETGDVFILFHYYADDDISPIKLQIIPTERVKTPPDKAGNKDIIEGIEYDKNGREIAYWINETAKEDSSTPIWNIDPPKYKKIEKRTALGQIQIVHLAIRNETNDSRGIPLASNIFHELETISEAIVAELEATKMNAATLGVIEREIGAVIGDGLTPASNFKTAKGEETRPETIDMFNAPNIIYNNLNEGEKFKDLSTARPNLNIPTFIGAIMRPVSSGKGVPHEVLEGGYDSNYSASRAAIQQFWKSIEVYRDNFISCLFVPFYEALIDELVEMGELELKGYKDSKIKRQAWLQHGWIGSAQPTLDPNKDIKAIELAIKLGLMTRGQASIMLYGNRFEENVDKLKEEAMLMKTIPSLDKTPNNQASQPTENSNNDNEEENESED